MGAEEGRRKKADGGWENPRTEVGREEMGTQSAMTYIERQQGTVAQLVELWKKFEV